MSGIVIEEFPHADEIGAHCTDCEEILRLIPDNRDHWREIALWTAKHECGGLAGHLRKIHNAVAGGAT